jgi:enoyl-CoA hydratase
MNSLLSAATELARKIASNPPLAIRKLKDGLRRALDPDWKELGAWSVAACPSNKLSRAASRK